MKKNFEHARVQRVNKGYCFVIYVQRRSCFATFFIERAKKITAESTMNEKKIIYNSEEGDLCA
jgi:hypothetical protein